MFYLCKILSLGLDDVGERSEDHTAENAAQPPLIRCAIVRRAKFESGKKKRKVR